MLARLVFGVTLRFSRFWEPGRRSAVWLETVFSVTDPPLKGLRKVIPPLRLGNVAIDLAFLVLLIGVSILLHGVLGNMM
ncbi:YggT family protein [Natronoglycomyces albus]|uniref:YggT family protein n=2 Tax=Natronoglycomyces albus TaxID=2811108 RepID=A0A895XN13_9ACTN|nr:YggT family protein [Natronoglycomyces albus]